jgi:hypothetical protein
MSLLQKIKNKYINRDNFFNILLNLEKPIDNQEQKRKIKRYLIDHKKCLATSRPHIFIAVKNNNWEKSALVESWKNLGDIYHYDWAGKYNYVPNWQKEEKDKFNWELLENVKKINQIKKIDIFFSYLSGGWVWPETIKSIGDLGIITINYSFDDSSLFWGQKDGKEWSGTREIAPQFDFSIAAQDEKDLKKYNLIGARAFFLPSAGNPDFFYSAPVAKTIPVSFVGQYSKIRARYINFFKKNGIAVLTRGSGWPDGPASQSEMLAIFQKSLIVLGFGFVGSRRMVRLKGRDFEVPMTGATYLTTYNKELSRYFIKGKEILFYNNKPEALNIIKHCLANKNITVSIGQAGEDKSLKFHTWEKRWQEVLNICYGS